jgi:hypothetical protein
MSARSQQLLAVVAVGLASVVALGCKTEVIVNGGTSGACPDTPPEVGAFCDAVAVCGYGEAPCGSSFSCTDGAWQSAGGCPSPPGACPAKLPTMGAPCKSAGQACTFTFPGSCSGVFVATCDAQLQWAVTDETPPCMPPGPCSGHVTTDACAADVACRWLVPGCGMPGAMFSPGCFPKAACAADTDCSTGLACQAIDVNPCFDAMCQACSESTTTCL